jgi:hypothetical protein
MGQREKTLKRHIFPNSPAHAAEATLSASPNSGSKIENEHGGYPIWKEKQHDKRKFRVRKSVFEQKKVGHRTHYARCDAGEG